jgi:hypothetical protein
MKNSINAMQTQISTGHDKTGNCIGAIKCNETVFLEKNMEMLDKQLKSFKK